MVQFETGGRIGMALRVECCIRVRDCADTTLSVCFSCALPGHLYEIFMNRSGLSEHGFATLSLTVGKVQLVEIPECGERRISRTLCLWFHEGHPDLEKDRKPDQPGHPFEAPDSGPEECAHARHHLFGGDGAVCWRRHPLRARLRTA